MRNPNRVQSGFTLVELLVVIAIIGLLVALLLPAVQSAREAARRTQCTNNMKQWGLALQNYHTTLRVLPPGCNYPSGWGWRAMSLPYLEQGAVHDMVDFDLGKPCYNGNNLPPDHAGEQYIDLLYCPSDPRAGQKTKWNSEREFHLSNYFGVSDQRKNAEHLGTEERGPNGPGDGTFYFGSKVAFRHMTDGLSNTVIVGERGLRAENPWGYGICSWGTRDGFLSMQKGIAPGDDTIVAHEYHFWSYHPGGAHFLFGDGRVRYISEQVDLATLRALATIAGAEVVGEF
jgi:prepilin-type N-terminal cleavage/methylation domain-containing protein/prepilin-type processing-associated H-X9-DG protein